MLNDRIYDILLQADIDQLNDLCYLDKGYLEVCKNKNFWLDRLVNDNLDAILIEYPKTIGQWIKTYEKLLKLKLI